MKFLRTLSIMLLSAAGIVLLNVGFIFVMLGLLPTVVAYFIDDTPGRNLYKTVRATNLAGIIPIIAPVIGHEYIGTILQQTMADPMVWLRVYGAAAAGWILIWVCRWLAYGVQMTTSEARIRILERTQKELVEEWGEDITHNVPY